MSVGGRSVSLHLAQQRSLLADKPLVVFASGDGGWFGAAVGMFETIAAAGYPVAGVSSRSLLRGLRANNGSIASSHVREVYGRIIQAARSALSVPDGAPVILAGWSRGAALSVIADAEQSTTAISGVVAIGLSAEEDLNVDLDSDDETDAGERTSGSIDNYRLVDRSAARVAVIQSTGDGYFGAKPARDRFGADSATRRFFQVSASNHRFGGGEAGFRQALTRALNWVATGKSDLK